MTRSNVVPLAPLAAITRQQLAPMRPVLTKEAQQRFAWRRTLTDALAAIEAERLVSRTAAAELLIDLLHADRAPKDVAAAAQGLARRGKKGEPPKKGPSKSSLLRFAAERSLNGEQGLADKHAGRVRRARAWDARAAHLYARPSRPSYATVAGWLRGEGFADASDHAVRRYLKSLPSHQTETAPARVGRHYYNQNIRPHVVRDSTVLPVGLIYEGDGHTCDLYVQHPRTGKPWRPELTVWIDVRSHYIVGWYLSEAESAHTTLYALSWAVHQHAHVPALLHVDPGSGFINKMITGEAAGFCQLLSMEVQATIPGNAKGKGLIEGQFRVFRDRCDKQFPSYCGKDRTDDALRRLQANIASGKIKLPTLLQYRDAVAAYVDAHNARRQPKLGASPAELWATLECTPTHLPPETLVRPRETRTVRRWGVSLHDRLYRHNDLAAHEGREVIVGYDLHDASQVWIVDGAGRPVCQAPLVEAQPWLPASRIEDLQQIRKRGQQRRLQARLDEVEARARPVIDHVTIIDDLDALAAPAPALPKTPGAGAPTPAPDAGPGDVPLDLYRTDY